MLDEQRASEYANERATADIIKAAASAYCPAYAIEIVSLRQMEDAIVAKRGDALPHRV